MGFPKSMAIAMSGALLTGCAAFAVGAAPTAGAAAGTAKISSFNVRWQREPDPTATTPSTDAAGGPEDGGAATGTDPGSPAAAPAPQGDQTSAAMLAYLRFLAAKGEFTG